LILLNVLFLSLHSKTKMRCQESDPCIRLNNQKVLIVETGS